MIYYDRIDVSQRTDIIKTSEPKECDICNIKPLNFNQMSAMDAINY